MALCACAGGIDGRSREAHDYMLKRTAPGRNATAQSIHEALADNVCFRYEKQTVMNNRLMIHASVLRSKGAGKLIVRYETECVHT